MGVFLKVKKKVLFMLSSMNIGGVEKSLLSLLSVIPKDKYEITVLLLKKNGGFINLVPEWIKVIEVNWFKEIEPIILKPPQETIKEFIKKKPIKETLWFLFSYLLSKNRNDRHIFYKYIFKDIPTSREVYDVAISYQGPTEIIDYYIANKIIAKKKISWIHFDVSKHTINLKLYKKLYENFDKVFVVSKEAKEKFIEKDLLKDKEKVSVFKNIISPELIRKMSIDNKFSLDKDYIGTKIVTVGRLSKEKGQDIAIKVLAKLIEKGYKVRWYCVGEGKDKLEYERLISTLGLESSFIFIGQVLNPYPYIAESDIYVQTSRHEGYCLTLAEARCLRKPIITTNFTGANEQINDQFDGFIVGANENELFEKVKYLLENNDRLSFFSNNLRQSNVDTTNEIEQLYEYIDKESAFL